MIRINLLPQKKAKRADRDKHMVIAAAGSLVLLGLVLYLFVHAPLAEELEKAEAANARLTSSIRKLSDETKDFDLITQQFQAASKQGEAIRSLNEARVGPAWMLRELSNILTKDHKPTMTAEMAELVKADHNRQWIQGWDPKRVWIDSLDEKQGEFSIKGGAQSDSDITQFTLRLMASVFFPVVVPEGGSKGVQDGKSIFTYTINGKVAY
ncbi:MAG: PilN domain-containing protein [Pseudomonadota bacterium]